MSARAAIEPLRETLERLPAVYIAALRLRHRRSPFLDRIVSSETDIVIEGFPRSGNSFANRAFQLSQPAPVSVATHVHSPAQIRRAVGLGIPTLVVLRDPLECVPSLFALRVGTGRYSDTDFDNLDHLLKRYIFFHQQIAETTDDIVLAPFSRVTTDYGLVIDEVNARFSRSFTRFEHSEQRVADVFAQSGSHLSPSAGREPSKEIGRTLLANSDSGLIADASEVFDALQSLDTSFEKGRG